MKGLQHAFHEAEQAREMGERRAGAGAGWAGALFLGGYSGDAQLLGFPSSLLGVWSPGEAGEAASCQSVNAAFLPNCAPLLDAQLFEDIPGEPSPASYTFMRFITFVSLHFHHFMMC